MSADAQFAIDIAAEMTGGTETLSELDALTKDMRDAGKNAQFFQDAMSRVGKELDAAKTAAVEANSSLAAGEARYGELERAANQAAKAAERAGLRNKGVIPFELASKSAAAALALEHETEALRHLETAAKAADAKQAGLSKTLTNLNTLNGHVNKSVAGQAESLEKLRGALGASGGALGQFGSKLLAPVQSFAKLSGEMGAARAASVILGVATAALAATVLVAGAAALSWGVGLSDSARSARLTTAAVVAMHPEIGALSGTIAEVADATGMHSDELQELAGRLREAKVSAADMPAALRAAALAETALGKGGAADFVADIKAGDVAVAKLAADTQSKLGGIVAQQMRGLSAQSARLSSNFGDIFGGLDIEPLLDGFALLVGLFDKNTASGQALKFAFETIFQPAIDMTSGLGVSLEALVLRFEILGLKAYLALRPWTPLFKDIGAALLVAGAAFAVTFAPVVIAGIGAAAVALGGLVASAAVAAVPFLAIGAAVVAVYEAFQHWTEIKALAASVLDSVSTIGGDIIAGIVAGITGGAGAVINAIGGAVTGAIDHAEKLLGIKSPSKVFAKIGGYTAEGFAGGVEDGAPAAQDAMSSMVSPSDAKQAALSGDLGAFANIPSPADAPRAGAAPAASGAGVDLSHAVFQFYGVEGAADVEGRMGEILTKILEGKAAQLGTAPAGAFG